MAPKRALPPISSSSSSEEEEATSGEEEVAAKDGSSSQEEEKEEEEEEKKIGDEPKMSAPLPSASATDKKVTPKRKPPPLISQTHESSSSSESGSGSGSESESDADAENSVKPIASKPMEETPKRPKLREKAQMTMGFSVKSPSQTRESKRTKKGSEAVLDDGAVAEIETKKSGDESKKPFQRLWSEDDELAILKGIYDYRAKKGIEPPADMNDLHNFIKKHLCIDVSTSQLRDKVRRLKKKYKNNLRKGRKGEDPTFSKPHEQKAFELAKKVWGSEVATPFPQQPIFNGTPRKRQGASSTKSLKEELLEMPQNVKENDKMHADGNLAPSECLNELLDFHKNRGVGGLPESVVKRGLELIEGSKKAELEEQWKELHVAELELFMRRAELVRDQAKLILESYNSFKK